MSILLHSSRLIIRNFQDSDLDSFLAYRNISEVAKYQGWEMPYSREKAQKLIDDMKEMNAPKQGQWLQLAVEYQENGEMIGDLGLRVKKDDARQAVIGYTIAQAFWRKGIATEAVRCLLGYLFEDIDMHRVSADCDVENIGSWHALEKIGFRREAHFVESFHFNGVYTSEYHYGMLQREWRNTSA